jgi:hypothetical protein
MESPVFSTLAGLLAATWSCFFGQILEISLPKSSKSGRWRLSIHLTPKTSRVQLNGTGDRGTHKALRSDHSGARIEQLSALCSLLSVRRGHFHAPDDRFSIKSPDQDLFSVLCPLSSVLCPRPRPLLLVRSYISDRCGSSPHTSPS